MDVCTEADAHRPKYSQQPDNDNNVRAANGRISLNIPVGLASQG